MTTEKRTLTVDAYRTPSGEPTCCAKYDENCCRFLVLRNFGLRLLGACAITQADIFRSGDDVGYLVPVDDCPIWEDAK